MGCDIEFLVERREESGLWVHVPFDSFRREHLIGEDAAANLRRNQWYDGRNYFLFGVLAGVRELSVPTIATPRGFPPDASEWVRYYPHGGKDWTPAEWSEFVADPSEMVLEDLCTSEISVDSHSRSWLGLEEVIGFDWTVQVPDTGYVDAQGYATWCETGGIPNEQDGGGSTVIPNDEMGAMLNRPLPEGELEKYSTLVTWTAPLQDYCRWFLDNTVAWMLALAAGELGTVRAVFHFDN